MRAQASSLLSLLLAACTTTNIENYTLDYPIVASSSEELGLGEVHIGESATTTLFFLNNGDLRMGVRELVPGPGHDGNFSFTYDPCEVICPETEAPQAGQDGQGQARLQISPRGGGTGATGPDISSDRTLMDFGPVSPPNTGTDWFVLSNVGTEDLVVSSAVQGGDSTFLVLNDMTGEVLTPGDSASVYVYYQPTDSDGDEGSLTLSSNDPDEPEFVLYFQGNVAPSGGDTGGPGDSGDGGGDGGDGGGDTGDTGANADCPVGDVAIEFYLDPGCQIPVEVTFAPQDVGDLNDAITIYTATQAQPEDWQAEEVGDKFEPEYYSDYLHEQYTVFLSGYGLQGNGNAVVVPRTIDFGHIWPGETLKQYIEVRNTGEAPLLLGTPFVNSACDPAFSVTYAYPDGTELPAGDSSLVEISFTPDDDNDAYCTVYIPSDDVDSPEIPVTLQGNVGTDPNNVAPEVAILDPEPGYVHGTSTPLEMTISIQDPNQPVTTLNCKVRSAVLLEAKVADCAPTRETGSVTVSIDMEPFDPGIDTFQVEVTDNDEAVGMASIPIILQSRAETSDDDGDGFGDADDLAAFDCDDQYIYTYPKAAEIYDARDNDCDNLVDEGTDGYDDDGDRFAEDEGDCNDFDARSYPEAPEGVDNRDNNCNGLIDEGTVLYDDDGDGYADINNDCDDRDEEINPGTPELCDTIDNDCNGVIDDACVDDDTEPLVIGPVQMEQTSLEEGESVRFWAVAVDRDGDDLTWTWGADFGTFEDPAAPSSLWTAPILEDDSQGQQVTISLIVEDDDQQRDVEVINIDVYPSGSLYKTLEYQVVTEESTCSVVGGGGAWLAGLGLLSVGLRRRRS